MGFPDPSRRPLLHRFVIMTFGVLVSAFWFALLWSWVAVSEDAA